MRHEPRKFSAWILSSYPGANDNVECSSLVATATRVGNMRVEPTSRTTRRNVLRLKGCYCRAQILGLRPVPARSESQQACLCGCRRQSVA